MDTQIIDAPSELAVAGERTDTSSGSAQGRPLWSRIFVPIGVFLAGFGVFNWAELPLGWKDRTEQITRYLDTTVGLGSAWVDPALWTQKSIELALGIVAVVALIRRDTRWLIASIIGWMSIFTFWMFMDIWAEDRAELQEHTVYFVVFTQLLGIIIVVSLAERVARWLASRMVLDG